jgi:hypothetical protein
MFEAFDKHDHNLPLEQEMTPNHFITHNITPRKYIGCIYCILRSRTLVLEL